MWEKRGNGRRDEDSDTAFVYGTLYAQCTRNHIVNDEIHQKDLQQKHIDSFANIPFISDIVRSYSIKADGIHDKISFVSFKSRREQVNQPIKMDKQSGQREFFFIYYSETVF